jgi:exodeoxyribonuclease-3
LKIATWNINGIRARLDYLRLWLADNQPTVVCLQETKVEDGNFPTDEIEALGYSVSCHGQKAYNGVAVLTRGPHETQQVGLPNFGSAGARMIHVTVRGTHVINLYCPNGKHLEHDDYRMKLAWYDGLIAYVANLGGSPRVLVGDFNIVPGRLDGWDEEAMSGKIFHTDEERSRFSALLASGLQDVWRAAHPDAQEFSWWDYRGGAFRFNKGLRIDFVLAGGGLEGRVLDTMIDRNARKKRDGLSASDHAPVLASFETT